VRFGLGYFPVHYGVPPGELAAAAEERGFSSLLFCDHTHIPTSRQTPYPGGGDLPRNYIHTHEVFIACTAAVAATSRLRVGTGVCLVVERDPIVTAKTVASVDQLSGGRFLFGVGAGWNREEMAHHGTDPRTRMRLLGERMRAMREIWTRHEAEFHGEFVDFDPIWSWPKPVQQPLPVLAGGMGPTVEDRILEFADGWLAQAVDNSNATEFKDRLARLQERAATAGHPHLPVQMFDAAPNAVDAYADAGVDEVNFVLPDGGPDEVWAELDRLATFIG